MNGLWNILQLNMYNGYNCNLTVLGGPPRAETRAGWSRLGAKENRRAVLSDDYNLSQV